MESSMLKKAAKYLRESGKNKRWRKVLTVLGAAVVFVTAYVLLMPAVAIERKTVCELEEHTHTEECQGQILACGKVGAGDETEDAVTLEFACVFPEELHTHTEECYDSEDQLLCGYADYAVHTHDSSCYESGALVCSLPEVEEHEHTEACYQINDSGFICGQEESEAHTHTDACYTEHKELTCEEAEKESHTHTEACYSKDWETICGLEESEGHTHADGCYGEDGALSCGLEESAGHTHDETICYNVTKSLTCGRIENQGHVHGASCYVTERELTCGREENPQGHTHTEECRGVVKELVCGKEEVILHEHAVENGCYEAVLDGNGQQAKDENGELLWKLACSYLETAEHIHGEECFQEHEHTEECYEEGLICGLEEHVHTEECRIGEEEDVIFYCAGRIHAHAEECFDSEGSAVCGYGDFVIHAHDESCYDAGESLICPLPEIGEHAHSEECFNSEGSLVCELPEASLHTHTEACYDGEGIQICKKPEIREHRHSDACRDPEVKEEETEEQLFTKTCEGDGYMVTVSYRADANIPEEAELIAEQITQEENEAHYAERQAQFQKTLKDEGATIRALLKIGFYVNGEEIEPESDVTVTVQLLDENGLAEGGPVTVVHFAKDDTEVLDGSNAKDNSTTFQMGSFSEIAIGYRTGEEESAGVYVSRSFEYEDDAFRITFHIEGNAQPLNKEEKLPAQAHESGDGEGPEAGETKEEEPKQPEEETAEDVEEPEAEEDGTQEQPDSAKASDNDEKNVFVTSEDDTDGEEDSFSFQVTPIGSETEEYKEFLAYAEQSGGSEELLRMQVFSYSLTYEGIELDLSNCRVKAEITMTPALKSQMNKSIPEAVSYLLNHEGEALQPVNDILEADLAPEQQGLQEAEKPAGEEQSEEEQQEEEITEEEQEETAADSSQEISDENGISKTGGNETGITISIVGKTGTASEPDGNAGTDDAQLNSLASIVFDDENPGTEGKIAETELNSPEFSLRISATVNPHFTVQYYANLQKMSDSGDVKYAVPMIDTSGGKLPQNGNKVSPNDNAIKNMYIKTDGVVAAETVLTEVYKSRQYTYIKAPTVNYFDALYERKNYYTLKEIWVYKGEKVHNENCYGEDDSLLCDHEEITSVDKADWDIYFYSPDLHFTNREDSISAEPGSSSGYVLIEKNAIIRLVYDVTTSDDENYDANFYDYDITNGYIFKNVTDILPKPNGGGGETGRSETSSQDDSTWYAYTKESGINSSSNYTGSGAKLAFGNSNENTGTGLGDVNWQGYYLNKGNAGSYQKCTFGLVTGLDAEGNIQYAEGVDAPNLFNEGAAAGKTSYDDYSLKFIRNGDTYTLSAVNGTGAQGLHTFSHPSIYDGVQNSKVIWTNNFWPMDSAPSFGTDGHDLKFGDLSKKKNRNFGESWKFFPSSDDNQDHNSYFGMQYEVEFELSEDYVGPLEYYFYGDDDMWVFLDNELVCDIGGIHSSVGEYVNLWDYLEKGSSGTHTLSFFYTERGASGSTCWMQFTLPSASSKELTTNEDYGELKVSKEVVGTSNVNGEDTPFDPKEGFEFEIKLVDSAGNHLQDDYSYTKYSADGTELESDLIIWNGGRFILKTGEYIVIRFIPRDAHYIITEKDSGLKFKQTVDDKGRPVEEIDTSKKSDYYYFTDIEGDVDDPKTNITEDKTAEGSIPSAGQSEVRFTNRIHIYELPESGGSGTNLYTMAGISLLLMAGLMYRKKFKEGGKYSSRN